MNHTKPFKVESHIEDMSFSHSILTIEMKIHSFQYNKIVTLNLLNFRSNF